MWRLKIMPDDYNPPVDPFGTDRLADALKAFCWELGSEYPMMRLIEVDDVLWPYAIPLHLSGKDRWEEFDAEVIFLLRDFPERENRQAEACRLGVMAEEFGIPCLLTTRAAFSPRQDGFYRRFGFKKMPVTWLDNAGRVYEVFLKGQLDMGPFANLMGRVEYIGREIVYRYYEI